MGYAFLAACRRYPPFSADQKRTKAEQNRELQDKILKGQYRFHKTYWDAVSEAAKEVVVGLLTVRAIDR
jgi:hypothetical protein